MPNNPDYVDQSSKTKKQLLDQLYNPFKLRTLVTTVMLMIAYFAVFTPLNGGMEATTREIRREQKRLELGREVEKLRAEFQKFKNRVPKQRDPNEWVTYMIDGIQKCGVKLESMAPDDVRDVGPYKATVLRITVSGSFTGLDTLLNWLEKNEERLIRVDSVKIGANRTGNGLNMQLVVLGIMG